MKSDCLHKSALPSVAVSLLLGCILFGCNKQEVNSVESNQQESTYKLQLENIHSQQKELGKKRSAISARMRELVSACGGDEKKAKALPQWAKLEQEAKACDDEFTGLRLKATAIVRERLRREAKSGNGVSK